MQTIGIVALSVHNPADWVCTPQRDQWIATPAGPLLEATEGQAGLDPVATTPPPDRQGGSEQFAAALFDHSEEVAIESAPLWILTSGIQIHEEQPPRQIFADADRVTRDSEESVGRDGDHLSVDPERADCARVFGGHLRQKVRFQGLRVDVVNEDDGVGGNERGRQTLFKLRSIAWTGERSGSNIVGNPCNSSDKLSLSRTGTGILRRAEDETRRQGQAGTADCCENCGELSRLVDPGRFGKVQDRPAVGTRHH
ncbi:hypothetical protein GALL_480780 [mine drainage metagenome]|uniref:Uncharacterized protein n=1 Tax=mine drainage metagenome TaxID=410659 RepID=A0A1J5PFY2_9ZZZZ